jgi:hypothetical protein
MNTLSRKRVKFCCGMLFYTIFIGGLSFKITDYLEGNQPREEFSTERIQEKIELVAVDASKHARLEKAMSEYLFKPELLRKFGDPEFSTFEKYLSSDSVYLRLNAAGSIFLYCPGHRKELEEFLWQFLADLDSMVFGKELNRVGAFDRAVRLLLAINKSNMKDVENYLALPHRSELKNWFTSDFLPNYREQQNRADGRNESKDND